MIKENHGITQSMEKSKVIGILGLGSMGRIIAKDLAKTYKGKVIYLVRVPGSVKDLARKNNADVRYADVSKPETLVKSLKGVDIVIHAIHHEFNLAVMNACLKTKTHYIDLGGLFHFTKKQLKLHNQFKKANLISVIGMGAAPGITNVLAKYGSKFFDKLNNIEIKLGYVDLSDYKQEPVLPISYSIQTILEEFTWKPAVFSNGKTIFVEALSGREPYKFPDPIGVKKPHYSIHSEIATLPFTLKAKNVSFKIAFDDKFVDNINMLKSLGFLSDKEVVVKGKKIDTKKALVEILKKVRNPIILHVHEYEVIRVILDGTESGKKKTIILDAKIEGINETIDKDTGVPPSIVAQMIANEKIITPGVYPPESIVPEEDLFVELAKRNIFVYKNNERVN